VTFWAVEWMALRRIRSVRARIQKPFLPDSSAREDRYLSKEHLRAFKSDRSLFRTYRASCWLGILLHRIVRRGCVALQGFLRKNGSSFSSTAAFSRSPLPSRAEIHDSSRRSAQRTFAPENGRRGLRQRFRAERQAQCRKYLAVAVEPCCNSSLSDAPAHCHPERVRVPLGGTRASRRIPRIPGRERTRQGVL